MCMYANVCSTCNFFYIYDILLFAYIRAHTHTYRRDYEFAEMIGQKPAVATLFNLIEHAIYVHHLRKIMIK